MLKKIKGKIQFLTKKYKIIHFVVIAFLVYLIISPFLPEIVFQVRDLLGIRYKEEVILLDDDDDEKEEIGKRESRFKDFDLTGNRLIIPTIGVHIPIVEGNDESVLYKGAWRRPNTGTPDKGGNTVITGHRFHYIPPNNKTFYNLNKVVKDSKVFVFWKEKEYIYKVYETFIVEPTQVEIEEPMEGNILTLYTCHPLWTADKRLVVRAKLLEIRE